MPELTTTLQLSVEDQGPLTPRKALSEQHRGHEELQRECPSGLQEDKGQGSLPTWSVAMPHCPHPPPRSTSLSRDWGDGAALLSWEVPWRLTELSSLF